MAKKNERGRSADDGRFMPADKARNRSDAIVETFKTDKNGKPLN